MDYLVAALFGVALWFVGVPWEHRAFAHSWLGSRGHLPYALTLIAFHVGAAMLGMWASRYVDWPAASSSPAWIRGLAGGSIGVGAARVNFTKLPSVGSGLSLLGEAIQQIDKMQSSAIRKRVRSAFSGVNDRDLLNTTALMVDETRDGDPKRVDEILELAESLKDSSAADHAESRVRLTNFCQKTISNRMIVRGRIPLSP